MNRRSLLAFAVPALLALGLAAWAWWPYGGEEILLETRPVDPPDLLRGDYVDLRYSVSTLPGRPQEGETVYVVLAPGDKAEADTGRPYWEVKRWDTKRPTLDEEEVCMKGQVHGAWGGDFRVRYGIEHYFIQKDETLEEWQGKEVGVVVKVRGCTPRIAHIHLDGEPWQG